MILALEVIDEGFFVWDGDERVKNFSDEKKKLYDHIKKEINKKLKSEYRIPCLPSDIFGGITGDQLGGGHPKDYWFYIEGKQKGKRKSVISMEAFAGFFEYTALNLEFAINPDNILHYTVLALNKMLNQIL